MKKHITGGAAKMGQGISGMDPNRAFDPTWGMQKPMSGGKAGKGSSGSGSGLKASPARAAAAVNRQASGLRGRNK